MSAALKSELKKTPPVEVPQEDFDKFRSLHPQHGAWSWFIRTVLKNYVTINDVSNTDELAMLAAREINIKHS